MICIVAPSGSGKDTILQKFVEKGFKPIVSWTTRLPRHYEVDGVHYHFTNDEHFHDLLNEGFFAEHTVYRNWNYGIAVSDCQPDRVVIVEPRGLESLQQLFSDITVIYVYADEPTRRFRLYARGDNPEEIERRIKADKELFEDMESMSDFIFYNNYDDKVQLNSDVEYFIDYILKPYIETGEIPLLEE